MGLNSAYSLRVGGKFPVPEEVKANRHMRTSQTAMLDGKCSIKDFVTAKMSSKSLC